MQAMARNTKTMARRPPVESRAMALLLNIINAPTTKASGESHCEQRKKHTHTHTHTHTHRARGREKEGKSVGVWSRDRDLVVFKT